MRFRERCCRSFLLTLLLHRQTSYAPPSSLGGPHPTRSAPYYQYKRVHSPSSVQKPRVKNLLF
ncbi:hypothetical protein GMOD_00000161 [Pyrenophora seminiperda CCB06]|uniref:Secreted protein n=1 Tax=Pyrenophora seminiperda CCB06 TaxID=1302712 RepID=A0A3M7M6I0_9PLEO|nr:hypothetical protein GMOD_00000161 [Pyrenophora seminiperda CCB06]